MNTSSSDTAPTSAQQVQYDRLIDFALSRFKAGDLEAAVDLAGQACGLGQEKPEGFAILAVVSYAFDDMGRAIEMAEKAHNADPDCSECCDLLAHLHTRAGHLTDGVFYAKLATAGTSNERLKVLSVEGLNDLGKALNEVEKVSYLDDAERALNERRYAAGLDALDKEMRLNGNSAQLFTLMGQAFLGLSEFDRALSAAQAAIHMETDNETVFVVMADALTGLGRLDEAWACLDEALRLAPASEPVLRHAGALRRVYDRSWPRFDEARRDAVMPAGGDGRPTRAFGRGDDTPVRLGYLLDSACGVDELRVLENLLVNHDRGRFQLIVFSEDVPSDTTSQQLQSLTSKWIDISGAQDATVLRRIRDQDLDILVDATFGPLSRRPNVINARPAKHVVKWASPGSAVFDMVYDYVLADADAVAAGDAPLFALSAEALPAIEGASPVQTREYITFAATCDLSRLSGDTAAVFARVLRAVPDSRLLLGNVDVISDDMKAQALGLFSLFGVVDRIDFEELASSTTDGLVPRRARFMVGADIFLDTPAVGGFLELADALWAGLPVVTLKDAGGDGAMGAAIVRAAGMGDGVVDDDDAYVNQAADYAEKVKKNADWRADQNKAVQESALFKPKPWMKAIEAVYLDMLGLNADDGATEDKSA